MAVANPITPAERIAFRDAFQQGWLRVDQQSESRLDQYCRTDPIALDARYAYFDVYSPRDPVPKLAVAEPTPNRKGKSGRRRAAVVPWHDGEIFDPDELRKVANNPRPQMIIESKSGFMRQKDRNIIAAGLGTAYDLSINPNDPNDLGQAVPVPLPAAQKILYGTTGLTVAKLRAAKVMFDRAEVPEGPDNRIAVVASKQIDDLLADNTVTSSDYNTIRALVRGDVDTFVGWKFVRVELLPIFINGADTVRQAMFMSRGSIGYYGTAIPTVQMGLLPTHSFTEQLYLHMQLGSTRTQDYKVIEVQCKEA